MTVEILSESEPKSTYAEESASRSAVTSQEVGRGATKWQDTLAAIKYAFTTRDGWIGDYVCSASLARHTDLALIFPRITSTSSPQTFGR